MLGSKSRRQNNAFLSLILVDVAKFPKIANTSDRVWFGNIFYKRNMRNTGKIWRLWALSVVPMRMLFVSHFQPQREAAFCRSNRRLNVGIKYGSAVKVRLKEGTLKGRGCDAMCWRQQGTNLSHENACKRLLCTKLKIIWVSILL